MCGRDDAVHQYRKVIRGAELGGWLDDDGFAREQLTSWGLGGCLGSDTQKKEMTPGAGEQGCS